MYMSFARCCDVFVQEREGPRGDLGGGRVQS